MQSNGAAAAAASSSAPPASPSIVISAPDLLSAELMDVCAEMNMPASRLATQRFDPVPNHDAFLRYLSQDTFHLHPPIYPR